MLAVKERTISLEDQAKDIRKQGRTLMRRAKQIATAAEAEDDMSWPVAHEAEKGVLEILMMAPPETQTMAKALELGLTYDFFYLNSTRTIFTAMNAIHLNGESQHPITIQEYLKKNHKLEEVGGPAYIAELIDNRWPPSMLSQLIEELRVVKFKRETLKKANQLQKMAMNGATLSDLDEAIDNFERANSTPQPFTATPSGLIYRKPGRMFEPERLTNFTARIVSEQIEDDGSLEELRVFEIECELEGRKYCIRVPSSKFGAMAWATAMIGARAIVYPAKADTARAAIQSLSRNIRQLTVYTHTGWREIDGVMSFLHSGGAITPTGNRTDVAVRLSDSLRMVFLPEPPSIEHAAENHCCQAFNAVLELKSAFPAFLTIPMIGSILGSVLGSVNYSFFLTGESGTFKSELTALGQSFFGAGFDSQHFPANWNDTSNVILAKMFTAKDVWMVIDDFVPIGQKQYDDKLHAKAEVVFRAAANRSGRGRANQDGSERNSKEPRALAASSGEDIPKGGSLQNRCLFVSLKKGDIDTMSLTAMQALSKEGKFALAMSAFIQYVASDYRKIIDEFNKDRLALRQQLIEKATANKTHTRQPTTLTHLAASWRVWLKAAVAREVLTQDEAKELWAEIWKTLFETIEAQKEQQSTQHPADYFIRLFRSALLSGRCHLATVESGQPETPNRYGWRSGIAQGECAGWVHNGLIYMQPETAYKHANAQGFSLGEGIPVGPKKLWERLDERGMIALKDNGRGRQARVPVIRESAIVISDLTLFDESE